MCNWEDNGDWDHDERMARETKEEKQQRHMALTKGMKTMNVQDLKCYSDIERVSSGWFQQRNGEWVRHSWKTARDCANVMAKIAHRNGYLTEGSTEEPDTLGTLMGVCTAEGLWVGVEDTRSHSLDGTQKTNVSRIRKYYKTMTEGEKQYMANKLWKDDEVCAQKIRSAYMEPQEKPTIYVVSVEEV
jgi:hypothetical protein